MTILATRILPIRELRCDEFICKRCGIDFTGRPNTHCKDCRSILRKEP
ncbi:hypothetical protein [Arthrobacter luteolus]|nr:hypothetical protein [Arthrobacter luteolus]